MTCAEARSWLTLRQPLPLEAGAELKAAVSAHARHCPACAAVAVQTAARDTRVGKGVRDIPLPSGLRDRLLVRAENARRARDRQRLFRATVPLAASMLLALILWHHQVHDERFTTVHLPAVETWARALDEMPPGQRWPITAVQAEKYLPHELRARLDLKHLRAGYETRYRGRNVAVLEFENGSSRAVVVLLPALRVEPTQLLAFPGRYETDTRIWLPRTDERYVAVVVIRAGQYRDFLRTPTLPSGA